MKAKKLKIETCFMDVLFYKARVTKSCFSTLSKTFRLFACLVVTRRVTPAHLKNEEGSHCTGIVRPICIFENLFLNGLLHWFSRKKKMEIGFFVFSL